MNLCSTVHDIEYTVHYSLQLYDEGNLIHCDICLITAHLSTLVLTASEYPVTIRVILLNCLRVTTRNFKSVYKVAIP